MVAHIYPELLDCISDSRIRDKSKLSGMSKALVCLQATWFTSQCISRLVQAFPLSLLEVSGEQRLFGADIMARSDMLRSTRLPIVSRLF